MVVACAAGAIGACKSHGCQSKSIRCQSDADCPGLACGPCDPGKIITSDMIEEKAECYVNPCRNPRSYCNPEHLCAIHPQTAWRGPVRGIDAGGHSAGACGCNPADPLCGIE
jgi:hypothetical protein